MDNIEAIVNLLVTFLTNIYNNHNFVIKKSQSCKSMNKKIRECHRPCAEQRVLKNYMATAFNFGNDF